ncbi:thermonuclease family protein [Haladaptatus sp.]|uniref:thermonuclease family protein n=1 Tax=Haladaptatus sp. TaxID=1973141 RepID=UPI003C38E2F6
MIALVLLILGIIGGLASRPTAASITDSEQVTVTDVVDGDTLDIQYSNGSTDTVRLLGVDTPESYGDNTTDSGSRVTSRIY